MSVEEIKTQLAALPTEQQRQIAAYLVHLCHEREPDFRATTAERIDDASPGAWITPAQLRERWEK